MTLSSHSADVCADRTGRAVEAHYAGTAIECANAQKNRKHLSFGWSVSASDVVVKIPDPSVIQVYVASSSKVTLASRRTGVSNPSVNQL
jgi:hypothetical protein